MRQFTPSYTPEAMSPVSPKAEMEKVTNKKLTNKISLMTDLSELVSIRLFK